MRRYLVLAVVALVSVSGLATAQAAKQTASGTRVKICHATKSATNPYVLITVRDRATLRGHMRHAGDIIPASEGGCPKTRLTDHRGGVVLQTTMTGAAEKPGPGDPDGTGTATLRTMRGAGQICFVLQVSKITLPATAAHIHKAPVGEPGPVVVPLTPAPDASGGSHGCVAVDRALVLAILDHPDQYYVNVHTTDFPAGAIRGQLG